MGIVNATPDSFSDGGRFLDAKRAVEQGLKLLAEGAEMLDVGGESTRPGARPVSEREELERVLPVLTGLAAETSAPLWIDTTKSGVAREALAAGASVVNDVSAARFDPAILTVAAEARAGVVLMHMQGEPRTMQARPVYDDVVRDVAASLEESARRAQDAGIDPERIAIDPGIGFGKTLEHNLTLLRELQELRRLGYPIVLGLSRKSFLGALTGCDEAAERDLETAVATGLVRGADYHRVHDASGVRRALAVAESLDPREAPTC